MMAESNESSRHAVAIVGGAVSGAQVAGMLAERGAEVVVFEQNIRPFGKIEDGLPRWHSALRAKEYHKIKERLALPGVHFVPRTRIGTHVGFQELVAEWGFSAVILACGAWRDRPIPVAGVEKYVGKGLVYQNPFIIAFNHGEDPNYRGPTYPIEDGAVVIGGGLASLDCVKVLMLENTQKALAARGHEIDLEEMEKTGIPRACEAVGLSFADLGLNGATLVYRRDAEDMPLSEIPKGASPEREAKVRASRARILAKTQEKYGFHFISRATPDRPIVDKDRLVGFVMRRMTKDETGKLTKTDQTFEMRAPYFVSSIGSVPLPIEGIAMKGELFDFKDWDLGRLEGYPTVFSVGNVVTGKGNIVASRRHATGVAQLLIERYLGIADGEVTDPRAAGAQSEAEEVAKSIQRLPPANPERIRQIRERVRARQAGVGFSGDIEKWMKSFPPA